MKKILIFIAIVACMSMFGYIKAEQGDYSTLGYSSIGGYSLWRVNSSGHFIPGVASTLDIGTSALPVRALYAGTISGASIASGGAVAGTTGAFSGAVTGLSVSATGGPIKLYSRTKAQILAITTSAIGDSYYCSDCTAVAICVSTAVAGPSFTKVTDRTAACD